MPEREKDPSELGAMWMREGKRGTWFSGIFDGQSFVAFKNERKKPGDKQPDFRILRPKPREDPPRLPARSEPDPAWREAHTAPIDPDEDIPW